MVEEGVKALTGRSSSRDAWLALFPNLKSTDVIGIKINCGTRFHCQKEATSFGGGLLQGLRFL
ncbi:hypothetical protein ES705_21203 [subsurface metagenome]